MGRRARGRATSRSPLRRGKGMREVGLFGCGVWVCIVSGLLEVGDGIHPMDAAPVPVLRCSVAPGQGRRPACGLSRPPLMRPVALHTLDMGRVHHSRLN